MSRIFEEILYEVQYSGYADLPRYLQIRVEKWIEKLAQPITNKYWIQNRNEYAKVLLHCIVTRNFRAPFDKNPRGGPLPALPSHLKLSQRSSPHHSKFWDRIHSAMKHSGRGPQNIKPRGTERWKAIAPDLFRASAVPEQHEDSNGDGSTQQVVVDAGLGAGFERRLRQLHIENQHLRKQVQHLAHQRAAEAVAKSTLVNMVRRRSPSRSPGQSPRRALMAVGDPGDEETTIYVSNGVDKSGDSVSTTVLRRKKSQNSLLKTSSISRSPSRSPQRQPQIRDLSPQSLRGRSHFNGASRELSTNTNNTSHHLASSSSSSSAQAAANSIHLQNATSKSPVETLHHRSSRYDVTPVSTMSVRNSSRLDALDLDLSASTAGANYDSQQQRDSSLNRTLSSVKKQQVGGHSVFRDDFTESQRPQSLSCFCKK